MPKKLSITRVSKNNAKNRKVPKVPRKMARLQKLARELSKKQGTHVRFQKGK